MSFIGYNVSVPQPQMAFLSDRGFRRLDRMETTIVDNLLEISMPDYLYETLRGVCNEFDKSFYIFFESEEVYTEPVFKQSTRYYGIPNNREDVRWRYLVRKIDETRSYDSLGDTTITCRYSIDETLHMYESFDDTYLENFQKRLSRSEKLGQILNESN
jgi:hypothetical protein